MRTASMENLPRRVSPKSDAFFPVFVLLPARSRDVFPLHSSTLYSSCSQVFWSFEQAGALLFLSTLLILLLCALSLSLSRRLPPSTRPARYSIRPSFLYVLPPSSHLSAVSTSISKKSSRELFVGKCREPAVPRCGLK